LQRTPPRPNSVPPRTAAAEKLSARTTEILAFDNARKRMKTCGLKVNRRAADILRPKLGAANTTSLKVENSALFPNSHHPKSFHFNSIF
jgi:hypothetical protein